MRSVVASSIGDFRDKIFPAVEVSIRIGVVQDALRASFEIVPEGDVFNSRGYNPRSSRPSHTDPERVELIGMANRGLHPRLLNHALSGLYCHFKTCA